MPHISSLAQVQYFFDDSVFAYRYMSPSPLSTFIPFLRPDMNHVFHFFSAFHWCWPAAKYIHGTSVTNNWISQKDRKRGKEWYLRNQKTQCCSGVFFSKVNPTWICIQLFQLRKFMEQRSEWSRRCAVLVLYVLLHKPGDLHELPMSLPRVLSQLWPEAVRSVVMG